jgi:hypothetical protein
MIRRYGIVVVLVFCALTISAFAIGKLNDANQDTPDTACYKIASCTCNKGKAHGDTTRAHEPTTADYDDNNVPKFQPHTDVKCSICNKDGSYYCPVQGKNRK